MCEVPAEFGLLMAGSGSSKDIWMDDSCLVPSFPWMSVEEAGVGGNVVRGMAIDSESGGIDDYTAPVRYCLSCIGEDRDEGPISGGSEGRRQPCDTTDLRVIGLAVLELAN